MAIADHVVKAWEVLDSSDGSADVQIHIPVKLGPFGVSVGPKLDNDIEGSGWPFAIQVSLADGLTGLWDIEIVPGEAKRSKLAPQPAGEEPDEPDSHRNRGVTASRFPVPGNDGEPCAGIHAAMARRSQPGAGQEPTDLDAATRLRSPCRPARRMHRGRRLKRAGTYNADSCGECARHTGRPAGR